MTPLFPPKAIFCLQCSPPLPRQHHRCSCQQDETRNLGFCDPQSAPSKLLMFINKRSHIDIPTHLFETHPNAQVPLRSPIGMKRRLEGGLIQNDIRNQLQVAGLFPQSFIMLKSKISSKTIQWRSAPKFSQKKKKSKNQRNQRWAPVVSL